MSTIKVSNGNVTMYFHVFDGDYAVVVSGRTMEIVTDFNTKFLLMMENGFVCEEVM